MVVAAPISLFTILFVSRLVRLLLATITLCRSSRVVLLALICILQDIICDVDSLELVLVHVTRLVGMILVALLVIHVLDVFLFGTLLKVKILIVVFLWVESIRIRSLLVPSSPESSLLHLCERHISTILLEK